MAAGKQHLALQKVARTTNYGADVILIPEIAYDVKSVSEAIRNRVRKGKGFSIVAVAEGAVSQAHAAAKQEALGLRESAMDKMEKQKAKKELAALHELEGEHTIQLAHELEELTGLEARVSILDHLQRGGTPTAFDRWLATRFGAAAFRLAAERKYGGMVALRCGKIEEMSLEEALRVNKRVDLEGDPIQTARGLNLCLGDN